MTHSRKILAQAGSSLADIYDVQGSVIGLEELDASHVKAVHDLGGTIFSERLRGLIIRMDSTAIAQNIDFEVIAGGLPNNIQRVLNIAIVARETTRILNCSLALQTAAGTREFIIQSWDSTPDVEHRVRFFDGVLGDHFLLVPGFNQLPTIIAPHSDENDMLSLVFRGTASAFGAGTVTVKAWVYLLRPGPGTPTPGTPSSHGLPIPSW